TEADCGELLARARETEAELKTRSEREAEEARVEIEAERRRAELVIEQLRETKQALVADLRQIHATLARAAGLSETEAEELAVEGLESQVLIARDRYGVPRIEARSAADLCFGQGFCMGQERLWQLEFYRRVAAGRLAEIGGPDALQADRMMRTLGLHRVAETE